MDVSAKVKQFILENFYVENPDQIGNDTSLLESGLVDSTGVLEVIAFLESEFGIKVEDEETTPENLDSIGRIATYVAGKLQGQTAATG